MQAISLIIVDDHEIIREGLKAAFQKDPDFQIAGEAACGRELLQLLKTTTADVVLLDDRLPGESGIDLCASLTRQYPTLKVIILTAYGEQRDSIVKAATVGARGFLLKNVPLPALRHAIKSVARGEVVIDPQVAIHLIASLKEMPPAKATPTSLLTPQQEAIARLVAQGFTNREIAQQLYLSTNTVKFHVQNLLRKLEVRNRVALANKLQEVSGSFTKKQDSP
ncbi:response regulator [Desulfofundulus thermocisternus]|uniref:response regulator n=1 Tax=Desulfofundulus thermocisternus TaxID=42471 RepID=UPI00217DC280|nr:response regulator transcription factor [Desulfofundulus thermocisternus]MCS5695039.1 response regulator transcription factor [Desulfofundulus thermocisternus]